MKGPWVSRPWLDSWGNNSNVLRCPGLYTRDFPFFLLSGTKFPRVLVFAGQVAASRALDVIARHPSLGLRSTRSSSKHVRQKGL